MRLHRNVEISVAGHNHKVSVEEYGRKGTRAPTLDIIIYQGKRYVPYAARRAGIHLTMMGLFTMMYHIDDVMCLVYNNNPFLSMIKKGDDWVGACLPVPIVFGK